MLYSQIKQAIVKQRNIRGIECNTKQNMPLSNKTTYNNKYVLANNTKQNMFSLHETTYNSKHALVKVNSLLYQTKMSLSNETTYNNKMLLSK